MLCSLALLTAAVGAAGCGGPSEAEKNAQERYERSLRLYRENLREIKEEEAAYAKCDATYAPIEAELKELDGRLDVGLSYAVYAEKVGDASAAQNQITLDAETSCIEQVGRPLARALTQYQKAYDIWNECYEDLDCNTDTIETDLQDHWAKAGRALFNVDFAQEGLKPGVPPTKPTRPETEE